MFKVGDRVEMVEKYGKLKPGDRGTVKIIYDDYCELIGIEWDRNIDGHNLLYDPENSICKNGYGWDVYEWRVKLIDEEEPTCATTA